MKCDKNIEAPKFGCENEFTNIEECKRKLYEAQNDVRPNFAFTKEEQMLYDCIKETALSICGELGIPKYMVEARFNGVTFDPTTKEFEDPK